MSFIELVWKRKSIRNFKADDVEVDKIIRLLDAARSAPSGGNCQPWHFYVIKDNVIKEQLCSLACKQSFILNAPVHIVVCIDLIRTSSKYGNRGKNLYGIQDTAAAIQNLLLCATDENLATCWCGAFDEKVVIDILQLSENLRPIAIIPIGYAMNEPTKTKRRSIEEISTFIGFEDIVKTQSIPQKIKFEHSDMSGSEFNDLNLAGSEFVNINMQNCTFRDINFANTKVSGCDLTNVNIEVCRLDGFTVNGRLISDLIKEKIK